MSSPRPRSARGLAVACRPKRGDGECGPQRSRESLLPVRTARHALRDLDRSGMAPRSAGLAGIRCSGPRSPGRWPLAGSRRVRIRRGASVGTVRSLCFARPGRAGRSSRRASRAACSRVPTAAPRAAGMCDDYAGARRGSRQPHGSPARPAAHLCSAGAGQLPDLPVQMPERPKQIDPPKTGTQLGDGGQRLGDIVADLDLIECGAASATLRARLRRARSSARHDAPRERRVGRPT
jgi:hypothetical protein